MLSLYACVCGPLGWAQRWIKQASRLGRWVVLGGFGAGSERGGRAGAVWIRWARTVRQGRGRRQEVVWMGKQEHELYALTRSTTRESADRLCYYVIAYVFFFTPGLLYYALFLFIVSPCVL